MGKKVYEVAETIGLDKRELVEKINTMNLGFTVKNYASTMTDDEAARVQEAVERERRRAVVEERIQPGVIRRRGNRKEEAADAAAAETPPANQAGHVGVRIRRAKTTDEVKPVSTATEPVATIKGDAKSPAPAVQATTKPAPQPQAVKAPPVEHGPEETVPPATPPLAATPTSPAATDDEATGANSNEQPLADATTSTTDADTSSAGNAPVAPMAKATTEDPDAPSTTTPAAEGAPDDGESKLEAKRKSKARPKEPVVAEPEESFHTVALDGEEDEFAEFEEDGLIKRPRKPQPSNIAGFIDPEEIRRRLAKDNKTFGPGPVRAKDDKKVVKQVPRRKVVNQKDLYGGPGVVAQTRRKTGRGLPLKRKGEPDRPQITQAAEHKRVLRVDSALTVAELAHELGVKAAEIIKLLMNSGMMMTVTQTIDFATTELIAQEFGFTVQDLSFKEESFLDSENDAPEDLLLRAPVVTVMGHVDHGKTSLLDSIRDSRVTASEAGGITQHIGASTIDATAGKVVFLDTPGHEAFTALRARGAMVTDLVVLVVAADDGVMPQTVEAINHARAAGVPILVAVNKIDKTGANPQRVKQALTEYELIPEEWGGSTIFAEVSALTGENVPELLDLIQLQAEVLELKANPNKEARGVVLEAYKHSGRGTVATLIVQEGTLKAGDIVVSGRTYGRVRTMTDDRGRRLEKAGPSTPVEITGITTVPEAGEAFFVAKDERVAKEFTEQIKSKRRTADLASRKVDPWAAFKENKQLNVIIKADVQGSLEALVQALSKLNNEEVEVVIIHTGVGGASESDVQLAVASNAMIIGFNTRPESRAMEVAKREGINIESHSIIYDVIDRVKTAMCGLLEPIFKENVVGHVEVRDTFNVPKVGTVAGCFVTDGRVNRGAKCRLLRDSKIIYESRISSLKRFKDDAKEVKSGFECGLSIENYNDIKVGDRIELYEVEEIRPTMA